jgi:toxin ParE1/3/4
MRRNVFWTKQAKEDLRAIREYIARDAPATAVAYTKRLRRSVGRLREFPFSGQVVLEIGKEHIREILFGNYRVIYRVQDKHVEIVTVFHGSRVLGDAI